jgi:hypothetical protein
VRLRHADPVAVSPRPASTPGDAGGQRPADRLVAVGILVTIGLVVAGSAAQLVNYAFGLHVAALDSSKDGGAFGVVGDVALASAALAAWILLVRARARQFAVVALPLLLTFLAVDKALRLHDQIANWPEYYVPVLVATFAALALVGRRLPARWRRLIAIGLGLLAISFLIHLTGGTVLDKLGLAVDGWARQLKAVIKHGTEVAGWLILALALFTANRPEPVAEARSEACYA